MKTQLLTAFAVPITHRIAQEKSPHEGTATVPLDVFRAMTDQGKNSADELPPLMLSSATYVLHLAEKKPTLTATWRTTQWKDEPEYLSLLPADTTITNIQPDDCAITIKNHTLCYIHSQKGHSTLSVTIPLPPEKSLVLPACANSHITVQGANDYIELDVVNEKNNLTNDDVIPLPAGGGEIKWRYHQAGSTDKMKPAVWKWQHEIIAKESEGLMLCDCYTTANADEGDNSTAQISLPLGIDELLVEGANLSMQQTTNKDHIHLTLKWSGTAKRARQFKLSYTIAASSLSERWIIPTPNLSPNDKAIIYLAANPHRKYSADSLTGPFDSSTLKSSLRNSLHQNAYYILSVAQSVVPAITQKHLPIATTADGVITLAKWETRLEADGSTLSEGTFSIKHRNGASLTLQLPPNATLLTCSVNSKDTQPISPEAHTLEIPLTDLTSTVGISFTQKNESLQPIEGRTALQLPLTPWFIQAINWNVTLPLEYRADAAGNMRANPADKPNVINLTKNLCRNEQPTTELFYQRNQANQ